MTQNAINGTIPWAIAQGGTGSTQSKCIIQVVTASITAATSTATIPFDNTIPQISEGTQIGTASITPTNTTNVIDIYALCSANCIGAAQVYTFSLYRDSGTDALFSAFCLGNAANMGFPMVISFRVVAGSTSATTFTFRIGGNGATTISVNSYNSAAIYGGVAVTPIILTEIQA